jgi:hypothetical protein
MEGNMMMAFEQRMFTRSMETIAKESRQQHRENQEMARENQRANQKIARETQKFQIEFQARHELQMQALNNRMVRLETRKQPNNRTNDTSSGEMEVEQDQDASFSNENE